MRSSIPGCPSQHTQRRVAPEARNHERTVHPPSRPVPGALSAVRRLRPGDPAAPAGDRLRLLPSGPDLVHGPTSRGTRPSTPERRAGPGAAPLGRGFSPARADCGCRAPLPPRLARSTYRQIARRDLATGLEFRDASARETRNKRARTVSETTDRAAPVPGERPQKPRTEQDARPANRKFGRETRHISDGGRTVSPAQCRSAGAGTDGSPGSRNRTQVGKCRQRKATRPERPP